MDGSFAGLAGFIFQALEYLIPCIFRVLLPTCDFFISFPSVFRLFHPVCWIGHSHVIMGLACSSQFSTPYNFFPFLNVDSVCLHLLARSISLFYISSFHSGPVNSIVPKLKIRYIFHAENTFPYKPRRAPIEFFTYSLFFINGEKYPQLPW